MSYKHQPIRGFRYLSTRDSTIYNFIRTNYFAMAEEFNIQAIIPPILAYTKLFTSLGESSDIVRKELYSFTQKDGEEVSLVPELTRVIVEQLAHERIYTGSYAAFGPCFRYERPQKGRYRFFNQGSVELFGSNSPMKDLELFLFIHHFFNKIHINDAVLHINSIGTIEDRKRYINILKEYFEPLLDKMSQNSRDKFERGAFLRMLDSKDTTDLQYITAAPKITDYLSEDSQQRYNTVKNMLNTFGIKYIENPLLVRGLDYYNHIVFEYTHAILGAQSSLCGGGRYDGLFKEVAGVAVPAIGVGFGIDRLMLVLEEKIKTDINLKNKCFGNFITINIIPIETTEEVYAMQIAEELRKEKAAIYKVNVLWDGKVSKRMEKSSNADYVIIFGTTEQCNNIVNVKNMKTGVTIQVERENMINFKEKFN